MSTRREITRAATVDEIKRTAFDLMKQSGSTDVRFADIARVMSMTAPGLYRYFASRQELLTALVDDAFTDLGEALTAALDEHDGAAPPARLSAVCTTYRRWCTTEPVRFALVFGLPAPGFAREPHAAKSASADRAFACLSAPLVEAAAAGVLAASNGATPGPALQSAMSHMSAECPGLHPQHLQALMHGWSALHGFVSLEAFGQMPFPADARDELFATIVSAIGSYVGLPDSANSA